MIHNNDENLIPLRNHISVSTVDLQDGGGSLDFEAWFKWEGKDRLVSGIMLDLGVLDNAPNTVHTRDFVAFVSHCPHESCKVLLKKEPQIYAHLFAPEIRIPDHPVLLCPCHFSMFDPLRTGSRLSGPAHRGLFRFALSTQGDNIEITHLERSVMSLFG